MLVDDPTILALRRKVRAAQREFDMATAFHEAWKPAASDKALHERLNRSLAAHTFLVVRQALRREMLLALTRLWDDDQRTIGVKRLASTLNDGRVVDALVAECEAHWRDLPINGLEDPSPAELRVARHVEVEFAQKQSDHLRQAAADTIAIVKRYTKGGSDHATLLKLNRLRNKQLAHRDLTPTSGEIVGADVTDEEIEAFYQETLKLIHLLRLAADATHYDPEETARLHRRHAELFWAGVRGERIEGHPNYREPR